MWAQNAEFHENNLLHWNFLKNGFDLFLLMAAVIEEKKIPRFHFYALENDHSGPSTSFEIHQSWSFAQLPSNGDTYINKKCVNFQGQWCIQIMI